MRHDAIDYGELDPGICEAVRKLRAAGLNTTDSGDGVSKPADCRTMDEPHVHIVSSGPRMMLRDARRAQDVLGAEWYVEATYSTRDGKTILTCLTHAALDAVVKAMGYSEAPGA
jgi:hypothetical protein